MNGSCAGHMAYLHDVHAFMTHTSHTSHPATYLNFIPCILSPRILYDPLKGDQHER